MAPSEAPRGRGRRPFSQLPPRAGAVRTAGGRVLVLHGPLDPRGGLRGAGGLVAVAREPWPRCQEAPKSSRPRFPGGAQPFPPPPFVLPATGRGSLARWGPPANTDAEGFFVLSRLAAEADPNVPAGVVSNAIRSSRRQGSSERNRDRDVEDGELHGGLLLGRSALDATMRLSGAGVCPGPRRREARTVAAPGPLWTRVSYSWLPPSSRSEAWSFERGSEARTRDLADSPRIRKRLLRKSAATLCL